MASVPLPARRVGPYAPSRFEARVEETMPTQHTVKQDEHVAGIATKHGIEDYNLVWDFPDNADLKQLRENPFVLFPGDVLTVLDREEKSVTRPTGAKHRFVIQVNRIKLRLKVLTLGQDPAAGAPCKLVIEGGARADLTTDGAGIVEKAIARTDKQGKLVLGDADFSLRIGALNPMPGDPEADPISQTPGNKDSGWAQRLTNLGYVVPPADDRDADELRSAIEEFQCDHGLGVTGEQDAGTRAKLLEIHGS